MLEPLNQTVGAKPGQIVVVAITKQPTDKQPPFGKVVKVLGEMGAPGMATDIAIQNFGIPHE